MVGTPVEQMRGGVSRASQVGHLLGSRELADIPTDVILRGAATHALVSARGWAMAFVDEGPPGQRVPLALGHGPPPQARGPPLDLDSHHGTSAVSDIKQSDIKPDFLVKASRLVMYAPLSSSAATRVALLSSLSHTQQYKTRPIF